MTRPTDEEIRTQAEALAKLLIKSGLDMAKPHSALLTQQAEQFGESLINEQITRDTQERLKETPAPEIIGAADIGMIDIPDEEREAVERASKGTGRLHLTMLNVAADKYSPVPSGDETRQEMPARPWFNDPAPDLRIQNHPCTFTPEEQLEAIPEQVLIRKEREPVEVVLRFQAFGISSKGDLLQGQGRNEWTLIDLSDPSEALTHDIIHALKLCPMLPSIFSLVNAENVQALFRAYAAGYNHRSQEVSNAISRAAGPKEPVLKSRSAGVSTEAIKTGGPGGMTWTPVAEPIQPPGWRFMTWKGVACDLLSLLNCGALAVHWQRCVVLNAVDLIIANHIPNGLPGMPSPEQERPATEDAPTAVVAAAMHEIRHG